MPVDLDPLTATNSLGDTFWSGGALCNMCLPRSDANNRIQAAVALWGLQSTLVSKPGKSHAVVLLRPTFTTAPLRAVYPVRSCQL